MTDQQDCVFTPKEATLWDALVVAGQKRGARFALMQDPQNERPVTYGQLITRSRVLAMLLQGRGIDQSCAPDDVPVGIMLPGGVPLMTCFFALQSMGRCVAMINFNAGVAAFAACAAMARVQTIVTSRLFVEKANLTLLMDEAQAMGLRILYLEDLRAQFKGMRKIATFFRARFARHRPQSPLAMTQPAVILFTSGSEGQPKGVVLSHANIQSNITQFASHLAIYQKDVMFACLPMFHSFGLTVGALLPLLGGMRVYFYPTPLHYHEIPALVRGAGASILLSTDTFLGGYAKCAGDADFTGLRLIVAGAEKLRDSTRKTYRERFGVALLEGYGVTETSPVISVNKPDDNRPGTVGPLLPGIEARIAPVPGLAEGGVLHVRGPNVMLGYLRAEAPGVIQRPVDGWHDTGDIVHLDADGYLSIQGRARRFAKIGGEMVSLSRIESAIDTYYPGQRHAVVSVAHPTKGEALVLITDCPAIDTASLREAFRADGFTDLSVPRRVVAVPSLPLLGSGKLDYARLQGLAEKGAMAQMASDSDPSSLQRTA